MQAHRTKTLGRGRKATARGKKPRRNANVAIPAEVSNSHEEMLIKRVIEQPRKPQSRHLELQDIIYNSAPELRALAFKSGYNLGVEAFERSKGGMDALEHVLENAGFGKMIYHPFESMSTFTTYATRAHSQNLGMDMHVFEAGVISGYLSAHAGRNISVEETSCVYNGATHCMFVAKTHGGVGTDSYRYLDLPKVMLAFRHALSHAQKQHGETSYYMLSVRPLLNEPVVSEASKFLYLLGKLLTAQSTPDPKRTITQAINFLGIDGAKVSSTKKRGLEISLVYGRSASYGHFVDLTTAFISGLAKGAYGRNVQVSRNLSSRGVYNVKMGLQESGSREVA